MLRAITVVAVSLFCTACGQSSNSQGTTSSASVHVTPPDVQVTPTQASAVTASAAQPATPHSATPTRYSLPLAPDEWRAALAKAMRVSRVAEVDGKKPLPRYNTKYTFYDTKKTNLYAYGKYDGVVAYWLVPGARSNRVASEPYVGIEITVPNNNLPSLSLMPSYSSAKVDWLFLNHLAMHRIAEEIRCMRRLQCVHIGGTSAR